MRSAIRSPDTKSCRTPVWPASPPGLRTGTRQGLTYSSRRNHGSHERPGASWASPGGCAVLRKNTGLTNGNCGLAATSLDWETAGLRRAARTRGRTLGPVTGRPEVASVRTKPVPSPLHGLLNSGAALHPPHEPRKPAPAATLPSAVSRLAGRKAKPDFRPAGSGRPRGPAPARRPSVPPCGRAAGLRGPSPPRVSFIQTSVRSGRSGGAGDSRAEGAAPARGRQAAAREEPSAWESACEVGDTAGALVALAGRGGIPTPEGKGRPLG